MYSFRVNPEGIDTNVLIVPALRYRIFLISFLSIWLFFWSFTTFNTSLGDLSQGIWYWLKLFGWIFSLGMWVLGVATLAYAATYKEKFVFRADVIERYFCVVFKFPIERLETTQNTKLKFFESSPRNATISAHNGKDSLTVYHGSAETGRRLYRELKLHLPVAMFPIGES